MVISKRLFDNTISISAIACPPLTLKLLTARIYKKKKRPACPIQNWLRPFTCDVAGLSNTELAPLAINNITVLSFNVNQRKNARNYQKTLDETILLKLTFRSGNRIKLRAFYLT